MTQVTCQRTALALEALISGVQGLMADPAMLRLVEGAIERGYFDPEEDDRLFAYFGSMLEVRHSLLEVLNHLLQAHPRIQKPSTTDEWRAFVLAYIASCLLVGLDLFLVERLAVDPLCQRKLNEGQILRRIPRKQFTMVKRSLSDAVSALKLLRAMRLARKRRQVLIAMKRDPIVGLFVADLASFERYLDPRKRHFWRRALSYGNHSFKRQGASAKQKTIYTLLSWSGKALSEMRIDGSGKKVTGPLQDKIKVHLRPGDILITRHRYAMTNLFLPGYWPHAALYIGSKQSLLAQSVSSALPKTHENWGDHHEVLEALKDGVHFRSLKETLAVDAFLVLRPELSETAIRNGIVRAIAHAGKPYNFDFDFFRSDALVCTEVIYRAYDGLEQFQLSLSRRAGRLTLSADDLVHRALNDQSLKIIAAYGTPMTPNALLTGPAAYRAVQHSLQKIDG